MRWFGTGTGIEKYTGAIPRAFCCLAIRHICVGRSPLLIQDTVIGHCAQLDVCVGHISIHDNGHDLGIDINCPIIKAMALKCHSSIEKLDQEDIFDAFNNKPNLSHADFRKTLFPFTR